MDNRLHMLARSGKSTGGESAPRHGQHGLAPGNGSTKRDVKNEGDSHNVVENKGALWDILSVRHASRAYFLLTQLHARNTMISSSIT